MTRDGPARREAGRGREVEGMGHQAPGARGWSQDRSAPVLLAPGVTVRTAGYRRGDQPPSWPFDGAGRPLRRPVADQ